MLPEPLGHKLGPVSPGSHLGICPSHWGYLPRPLMLVKVKYFYVQTIAVIEYQHF